MSQTRRIYITGSFLAYFTNPAVVSGSIERIWANESAATAFRAPIGGGIFRKSYGMLSGIGRLSRIGLSHVLILGGVAFTGTYIQLKKTRG